MIIVDNNHTVKEVKVMVLIKDLCKVIDVALIENDFKESTINGYRKSFARIQSFAESMNISEYSSEFGALYIEQCILRTTGNFKGGKTGKADRKHLILLFEDYIDNGKVEFKAHRKPTLEPQTEYFRNLLNGFVRHLETQDIVWNTVLSYRFPAFRFLQYYESTGILNTDDITPLSLSGFFEYAENYFNSSGGIRNALCGLRAFALYLNREDLYLYFKSIKAPRTKHIVPVLTDEECENLWELLLSGHVNARDKSVVLLSLTTGIRASDIINLKFDDIDWRNETISFTQMKTGNPVCLPLLPVVGNAIFDYITKDRPKKKSSYIFLRMVAPYKPLSDHSSIYTVIKRVCSATGISFDNRICGTTLLRHNAASQMLRNGIPQPTTAAVLGHADPDTTSIYTTTDKDTMRMCMLPIYPRKAEKL